MLGDTGASAVGALRRHRPGRPPRPGGAAASRTRSAPAWSWRAGASPSPGSSPARPVLAALDGLGRRPLMTASARAGGAGRVLVGMAGGRRPRARAVCSVLPPGVAGLTLVSRVLGFARWIVQASTVGAGTVAGAYATANQVPNALYEIVVGGALAATVVPLLARWRSSRSRDVSRIASGLLGVVLAVLTPLALVLAALADPIAALLPASSGTDPGLQVDLVAAFLRMFAVQIPLYDGVVLTGVLQAMGRFAWPAFAPILSSLVVMSGLRRLRHHDLRLPATGRAAALRVLGWGTTAGVAALSLLLYPVSRLGVRLRPTLHLDRPVARRALRLGGAGGVDPDRAADQHPGRPGAGALRRTGRDRGRLPVRPGGLHAALRGDGRSPSPRWSTRTSRRPSTGTTGAMPEGEPPPASGRRARRHLHRAGRRDHLLAGGSALMASSAAAERFFALLTDVEGMGVCLTVLAPALVGYALDPPGHRILFAAGQARPAAHATALGWVTVAGASTVAVRLMAPDGGDGRATLVALAIGLTIGMGVAGAGMLAALVLVVGARAVGPTLRALVVGAPIALLAGLGARARWRCARHGLGSILVGAVGAVACAGVVMGVCTAADRRLLSGLRSGGASAGTPSPREGR